MSHTVQVNLTANQCIYIGGVEVNIHEINTIFVSEDGVIEGHTRKAEERRGKWDDADFSKLSEQALRETVNGAYMAGYGDLEAALRAELKRRQPIPKPLGLWRRGM